MPHPIDRTDIEEAEARLIIPIYHRASVVFTHGEGAYLFDHQNRRYLDFAAGIAVNALGHADPELVAVIREQAGRLIHVSNTYYSTPQLDLAQRLVTHSFADRVFFCNSGAEANDAAIKFARKWAQQQSASRNGSAPVKTEVITFERGFHGRTIGAVSVSGEPAWQAAFAPLMSDVTFLPYNDLEAARQAVGPQTCAVILETIQGMGGVIPATPDFLQGVRALCDQHEALLILDEVQCGLGRSGRLWAHEAYGITPDMMTLSKGLGGGLPIGATLVTEAIAQILRPGDHGCTFAGGPLTCRAAQVVFDRVSDPAFLARVADNGRYLRRRLEALKAPQIVEVRGAGLLVGVECCNTVMPLRAAALERGLLLIGAGPRVLRLCPPLIVTREQIDAAVEIIAECLPYLE